MDGEHIFLDFYNKDKSVRHRALLLQSLMTMSAICTDIKDIVTNHDSIMDAIEMEGEDFCMYIEELDMEMKTLKELSGHCRSKVKYEKFINEKTES